MTPPKEANLSSTSEMLMAAADRTVLFLCLLAVLVMVPWVGAALEELFGIGDDDDPDGYT